MIRKLALACGMLLLVTFGIQANRAPTESSQFPGKLQGSLGFQMTLGLPLNNNFVLHAPKLSQNLELNYHFQKELYFVELTAAAFGVFGANPYVNLPSIIDTLAFREAFVGFLCPYGLLFVGRYVPLMPVSEDDYRVFNLLFGNPNLPLDAISLYNETSKLEYELTLGYLSFAENLSSEGGTAADFFLATRVALDIKTANFRFQLSPGLLLSDLVDSYGVCLPFRLNIKQHQLEGEIAGYNLTGTTLLVPGFYPASIIKYTNLALPNLSCEGAYIHKNFLPYTGNMANFGGSLIWDTGTLGFKISLDLEKYLLSMKISLSKKAKEVKTTTFTLAYKKLPQPFTPIWLSLIKENEKLRGDIKTGLAFSF